MRAAYMTCWAINPNGCRIGMRPTRKVCRSIPKVPRSATGRSFEATTRDPFSPHLLTGRLHRREFLIDMSEMPKPVDSWVMVFAVCENLDQIRTFVEVIYRRRAMEVYVAVWPVNRRSGLRHCKNSQCTLWRYYVH